MWDAANLKEPLKTIHKGHSKSVDLVVFSHDGAFLASLSFNEICIWCTKVIFKVNYFVIVIIFTAKHFCIKTWDKIHQVTISAQPEEDQDPVLSWTSNGMLAVTKKDREVFLFHLLFFLTVL